MASHSRTALRQPNTSATPASSGSQTITQHANPTLRLRGQHAAPSAPTPTSPSTSQRRHIQWDESVVDNEGLGKKSSKACCIYHKPHEPGDSESEDSSSSDEPDSGGEDLSRARRAGGSGRGRKGKGEGRGGDDDGTGGDEGSGKGKGKQRKASPNAYERQPKVKAKQGG